MDAAAPALLRRGAIWGAICLALAGSGCVLPIGPEFQDPPAAQNFQPLVLESEPKLGSPVTTPSFRVTVQDPNVGDDLWVRFVSDYPPLSENTRFLYDEHIFHSADGSLLAEPVFRTFGCADLAKLPTHQITVIVADREFLLDGSSPTQPADPERLPAGAQKFVGTWTLNLECK